MLKTNDVVNFTVSVGKKGMGFEFKTTGSVTVTEPGTKKDLREALAKDILEEINEKLVDCGIPKFSRSDAHVRLRMVA